jgi:chromosome segregation ATPase
VPQRAPVFLWLNIFATNAKGIRKMSSRDEYVEKIKAKLDQWNAEIDKLEAQAREAEADEEIQRQKQVDELRRQRDQAEVKLKELQEMSTDAWNDMRSGFEEAWNNLSTAFESAKSRFK